MVRRGKAMKQYVVYTRVSTEDQRKSGLGLEAQERDIEVYLASFAEVPWEVIGRFRDIESGANSDRPQLALALDLARRTGAELLVSRLDRLSRSVEFIAKLTNDKKLRLRVASIPGADKMMLQISAVMAESERDFISVRTKAALKAAKARGVVLGGARDPSGKRHVAVKARADADAARAMVLIAPLQQSGATLQAIANALDASGFATSRGGQWTAKQVSRILART